MINEENPWSVNDLDVYLFYCCPECDKRDTLKEDFLKHALYQHPKSKEYFGNLEIKKELSEELNVEVNEFNDDTSN